MLPVMIHHCMDLIGASVLSLTKWIKTPAKFIYNCYFYFDFYFFVIYKNTPRKIKVVDVVTDNCNETAIDNTVQQLHTNQQVEPIKEDVGKPIETGNITEEQQIAIAPTTKVRTNELHACSKCGESTTLKTLKYTHEKTCGIVREQPLKKEKHTPKSIIQETQPLEPTPVPVLTPEPIKSFKEMRLDNLRERVKTRSVRIHNLFLQAFWIKLFIF